MNRITQPRILGVVCTGALFAGCSGTPPERATANDESAILGGFPATSPKFDPIGDIAEVLNTGPDGTVTYDAKCTGVLIGPHSVLTASHCLYKYGLRNSFQYTQHFFRIGADSSKPKHQVRVAGFAAGPDVTGGVVGFGSDIAVFQLAEDITDVTPMPIAAPLTDADLGAKFIAIGYGRQSVTEAAGTFDVRAFGTEDLLALRGNPVQVLWSSLDALVSDVQKFIPSVTAAQLTGFYNSPNNALLEGQQAYFTGIRDNGVQTCSGDSGGPILRRTAQGFEIEGVTSAGFVFSGRCYGGTYYGLPNTPDNLAFIQAQLADRTRGVAETGYCNAASAIRSTTLNENPDPIHILDCQSIGMVCGLDGGVATCVDPITSGPASTCTLVGAKFVHPRGAVFEFKTDGTYTIRGNVFGNYTFANGMLSFSDTVSFCSGTPGSYAVQFSADCNTATLQIAADPCEIRAEGFDLDPMTRQL